jgi:hypothetical protein
MVLAVFKRDDIRVGTELEIQGEYNEASEELRAKSIKVFLKTLGSSSERPCSKKFRYLPSALQEGLVKFTPTAGEFLSRDHSRYPQDRQSGARGVIQ